MTESTKEPVKAPALPPSRSNFILAEQLRAVYRVNVPHGVPVERLKDADYWAHVAPLLQPGFLLEALAQDGSYFAEFLVRKVAKTEAHVLMLRHVDLTAVAAQEPAPSTDDYTVQFGGQHKWRVIHKGAVIHKGEPSEADARAWLANHLKEVATA